MTKSFDNGTSNGYDTCRIVAMQQLDSCLKVVLDRSNPSIMRRILKILLLFVLAMLVADVAYHQRYRGAVRIGGMGPVMVLINGGSDPFMSSFLQGWRRKAGIVTLVAACALASGWLRSRSHCDSIQLPVTSHSRLTLGSANHVAGFSYETFDDPQENTFECWSNQDPGSIDEALSMDGIAPSMTADSSSDDGSNGLRWRIRFASFLFGQSEYLPDFKSQISFAAVPYWSVTIPLTLLSACLLLVPLRKQPPLNASPSHA